MSYISFRSIFILILPAAAPVCLSPLGLMILSVSAPSFSNGPVDDLSEECPELSASWSTTPNPEAFSMAPCVKVSEGPRVSD